MKGSTSARKTADGLVVTCHCGETFTLSDAGEQRQCVCRWVYRYDGQGVSVKPAQVSS